MLKLLTAAAAATLVMGSASAFAAEGTKHAERAPASPVIEAMHREVGGLQHVGIPTKDMQATTDFYTKLGFKILDTRQNGESTVRFFEYKGLILEVWTSDEATGKAGAINHIALDTRNADALYPVMKNAGYTMINDKVMSLPFWKHGIKYFNIKGPNGEIIEFCEKVK